MTDPLFRILRELPSADPNAGHNARVRARCHARLARQHGEGRQKSRSDAARVWPPLAAGLSGIYLAEVIRQALSVYGVL